jgi:hypothetical protein
MQEAAAVERRRWGNLLPPAEKVLPFHSAFARDDTAPVAPTLDVGPSDDASDQERAQWRVALAERRLRDAEQAYEMAIRQGKPARLLTRLRADVDQEAANYVVAADCLGRKD